MSKRNAIAIVAIIAFCLAISPAPAGGQISAKLVMEDQRAADHTLWLKWQWSGDSLDAHLELSDKEILRGERWDLCFENEQGLAKAVEICRASSGPRKVQVRGREIRTIHGRAWLIESIKTM